MFLCIQTTANMKKLAMSVHSDESSISSLQEDERSKLSVSPVHCVWGGLITRPI